jgi:uncharacterized membrane protein HdeD (DUF308 family)
MMREFSHGMQRVSKIGTVMGIVTLVLGVCAMLAPLIFGIALVTIIAVLLITAGIARLVYMFQARTRQRGTGAYYLVFWPF